MLRIDSSVSMALQKLVIKINFTVCIRLALFVTWRVYVTSVDGKQVILVVILCIAMGLIFSRQGVTEAR
jgi:hypothetical protein